MENFKLEKDIHLFCIKADSFPEGITCAQEKLGSLHLTSIERNHFGISYLYDDQILYMAGAELKNKEVVPPGCEAYTLRKGKYISIDVSNFRKDTSRIGQAFKILLDDPRIDENGCCAECYLPDGSNHENAKDVRCMVKLAD
jgi:hypothetical protein